MNKKEEEILTIYIQDLAIAPILIEKGKNTSHFLTGDEAFDKIQEANWEAHWERVSVTELQASEIRHLLSVSGVNIPDVTDRDIVRIARRFF